ncbi:hypothetical protein QAD02_012074 [Eretmocerus hayati]|uniref:Uncharacterized protein n=1 Tax=Eretmocerus hayati TaxID=131215 RepID=A0ACC2P1G1_9HYME|nr:hypothetical protein QAD02_012074 [Eretmocerus hayati]
MEGIPTKISNSDGSKVNGKSKKGKTKRDKKKATGQDNEECGASSNAYQNGARSRRPGVKKLTDKHKYLDLYLHDVGSSQKNLDVLKNDKGSSCIDYDFLVSWKHGVMSRCWIVTSVCLVTVVLELTETLTTAINLEVVVLCYT